MNQLYLTSDNIICDIEDDCLSTGIIIRCKVYEQDTYISQYSTYTVRQCFTQYDDIKFINMYVSQIINQLKAADIILLGGGHEAFIRDCIVEYFDKMIVKRVVKNSILELEV